MQRSSKSSSRCYGASSNARSRIWSQPNKPNGSTHGPSGASRGIVKLLTLCGAVRVGRWRLRRGTRVIGIRSRSSGTRCGCITVFALSLRDVEELLLARGVVVSHETVRSWCARFGPDYAKKLRRRRARPGDKWHLDEVFIRINGTIHYLWRAVDAARQCAGHSGTVTPGHKSGQEFFRRLLKGLQYVRGSSSPTSSPAMGRRAAWCAVGDPSPLEVTQDRAENSHQLTRIAGTGDHTLRLAWAGPTVPVCHQPLREHFRPRRHLMSAPQWRTEMTDRVPTWHQVITAAAT